jgi:hypothetical protein
VALGRAKGTTDSYHYTSLLFGRFPESEELPRTSAVLTTAVKERFALWLRVTPAKPQHGDRRRAESGIHAHLHDMRALYKWLLDQELLVKPVTFPIGVRGLHNGAGGRSVDQVAAG